MSEADMVESLKVLLSSESLLVLLMTPGMVVSFMLMFMGYKLTKGLGARFLDAQEKQAKAFEEIAQGVKAIQEFAENRRSADEDTRITLRVINEKMNRVLKEQENTNGPQ